MGSNQDIQEVKSRADIVTVVSRYVALKQSGRNYLGLCPFHGEKTPSFNVNPSLGIFKCFGCGEHGDVIEFVRKIEHLEFAQALEKLAGEFGVQLHSQDDPALKLTSKFREMNKLASDFYHYILLKHPNGKIAYDYTFNKRKFTEKTVDTYQIGYAPSTKDLLQQYLKKKGYTQEEIKGSGLVNDKGYDKYSDRLVFPIFDTAGHIVGFSGRVVQKNDERPKYLNSAESILYKKRFLLYGLFQAKDAISKENLVIICEGQPDTISSHQSGVKHIVAPLGTSLTDTQLLLASRYTKNIAFCFNTDAAGQKSLFRSAKLALALDLSVFVVTLPSDVKDIDELIQKRPDEWKDRAAHPQDFFALMGAQLKEVMKKDILKFEERFQEVILTLSTAPELKQQVVAKQLAGILGLTEQSILAALKKAVPISYLKEEVKQRQGALSTAEYLMGLLVSFPLPLLLMGKTEKATLAFPLPEQQHLFTRLAEYAQQNRNIIDSVLDKKAKRLQVSWVSIYTRFANELSLDFATWLGKLSQESADLAAILERLALDSVVSHITIADDVMQDFFKAWIRLQRQSLTLRLELLRKKLSSAELAQDETEIAKLQAESQESLLELKKLDKTVN